MPQSRPKPAEASGFMRAAVGCFSKFGKIVAQQHGNKQSRIGRLKRVAAFAQPVAVRHKGRRGAIGTGFGFIRAAHLIFPARTKF